MNKHKHGHRNKIKMLFCYLFIFFLYGLSEVVDYGISRRNPVLLRSKQLLFFIMDFLYVFLDFPMITERKESEKSNEARFRENNFKVIAHFTCMRNRFMH